MTDRYDDVLRHIDQTIDGADDDWNVSSDAMRWTPADPPEPVTPETAEDLFRTGQLRSADSATRRMVYQVLQRRSQMYTLEVVVPDAVERTAYLDACDNLPSLAVEYAAAGIPAGWVRDLRETGMTVAQAALTVHCPETTDARSTT